MITHLRCYFSASLATVVTVETPGGVPRVWIVHPPAVISQTGRLSVPRRRFSHVSQDVLPD